MVCSYIAINCFIAQRSLFIRFPSWNQKLFKVSRCVFECTQNHAWENKMYLFVCYIPFYLSLPTLQMCSMVNFKAFKNFVCALKIIDPSGIQAKHKHHVRHFLLLETIVTWKVNCYLAFCYIKQCNYNLHASFDTKIRLTKSQLPA